MATISLVFFYAWRVLKLPFILHMCLEWIPCVRYAFLTSLVRFTFLHAPKDVRSNNVEAMRTLLVLCESDTDALQDTYNAVLERVSRLEFVVSTTSISATVMLGSNQISRDAVVQVLKELAGKPAEKYLLIVLSYLVIQLWNSSLLFVAYPLKN